MAQIREIKDPKSRLRRREKQRVQTCLNCASDIETRYCPHCGQENATADLTLGAVLREFFAEVFYFDSKLWRTLRTLLFHPGRLSTEWSAGRRTSFLSPIRLYLSITFLFFVAATWSGGKGLHANAALNPTQQQTLIKELQSKQLATGELALIQDALKKSEVTPEMRVKLDAALAQAMSRAKVREARGESNSPLIASTNLQGWFGQQVRKIEVSATTDPDAFARRYVDQFPKVLFIILPLFAIVLKLLYWRQGRYFVEHLVFILHLHSFAFIVLLPAELIPGKFIPDVAVPLLVIFGLPIYAFVAMLRFYRQPWWLTLVKGLILNGAYVMLLAAGALLALFFLVTGLADPKPAAPVANKPAAASVAKPAPPPSKPVLTTSNQAKTTSH